jgi:hypothetical protein
VARARGARRSLLGAVAAVVVAAALAGAATLGLTGERAVADESPLAEAGVPAVVATVPSPVDVRATPADDGTVVVTWANPLHEDGDRYVWSVVRPGSEPVRQIVDAPPVTVTPVPGERTCVEVSVVRADRRESARPALGCTP